MFEEKEERILSLEQGRELIKNTTLAHLTDEELQQLLVCVKEFCEICFEMHLNKAAEAKIIALNNEEQECKAAA